MKFIIVKVLEKSVLRWNFYIMLIDNDGILSGLKNKNVNFCFNIILCIIKYGNICKM